MSAVRWLTKESPISGAGLTFLRPQLTTNDQRLTTNDLLYIPAITIGIVGVCEPPSFSIVTAKPLALTPAGSGGVRTVALPRASGLGLQ